MLLNLTRLLHETIPPPHLHPPIWAGGDCEGNFGDVKKDIMDKKMPLMFMAAQIQGIINESILRYKTDMKDTYYKGERETTNGLSEQMIFEIKEDFHSGNTIRQMAIKYGKTIDQIYYAIQLNEPLPL